MLAFALAVLFAEWRGWRPRRALAFGAAAGAFATLPDIDVVYAVAAIDGGRFLGGGTVDPEAFWDAANAVHRSMTHSLVVAAVAAPALGLWSSLVRRSARRPLLVSAGALSGLGGLVAVAAAVSGPLGGIVMGVFVLAGVGLAALTARRIDLSPRLVAAAAAIGLFTHPWGDLVTGSPPQMLYPFEVGLFDARVLLHPDPTIHLLGAFALELAVVWLAVLAVVRVTDRSVRLFSDRSAALGATYGVAALVLVPPTLEVSYHFVFSILAVGSVCGALSWYRSASPVRSVLRRDAAASGRLRPNFGAVAIALAGTTVALVGYVVVYVALA
nr:metal-dependent hydrolase [Halobellus rarus]